MKWLSANRMWSDIIRH